VNGNIVYRPPAEQLTDSAERLSNTAERLTNTAERLTNTAKQSIPAAEFSAPCATVPKTVKNSKATQNGVSKEGAISPSKTLMKVFGGKKGWNKKKGKELFIFYNL
jgi:hypothetical protein